MARVAVDAMGGDLAPAAIVRGALAAVRELPGVEIVLVGREDAILSEIGDEGPPPSPPEALRNWFTPAEIVVIFPAS